MLRECNALNETRFAWHEMKRTTDRTVHSLLSHIYKASAELGIRLKWEKRLISVLIMLLLELC